MRRPVNSYSPLALVSVVAMTLPAASSKSIRTPASMMSRIVEVAILVLVGMHAAADRAGQQLAEVVLDRVVAPVEHDLADEVVRRRRRRCAAGRVLAVEPAGGLHFADAVRARREIREFVVADAAGRGGRDRRDAGRHAVEQQLDRHAADALFAGPIEVAVVRRGRDRPSPRDSRRRARRSRNWIASRSEVITMPVKKLYSPATSCFAPPAEPMRSPPS